MKQNERHAPPETGIASLGVQFPPGGMRLEDLATLRDVDPAKFTLGLGCEEMALCTDDWDVVSLAVGACRRALSRWEGSLDDIGLLVVGTESAKDMSRPLSAWVADALGLAGEVRSYEVKHACYGGTLALRQAIEWRLSGAARGRAALVVAADVALYSPADPGEPTQGAGAVAFVVDSPDIAAVDVDSYAYSEPAFDFWRPVGEDFPRVEGPLSLDCYKRATTQCFGQLVLGQAAADESALEVLRRFDSVNFHVPFPKMVKKATSALGEAFGWSEFETASFFADKVDPTMEWNRRAGNCYTASLWIAVARSLAGLDEGTSLAAFSYGSGFGAELLTLRAGAKAKAGAWVAEAEADLDRRRRLDAKEYALLRGA